MIQITTWAGLATNASPYSIPPGAAVTQVNLQVLVPGEVSVRPGSAPMTFATHSGASAPIRSVIRYPSNTEAIVYQNAQGNIFVARGLS